MLVGAHAIVTTTVAPAFAADIGDAVAVAVAVHDESFVYQRAEEMSRCVRCVVGRAADKSRVVVSFFPKDALADVQTFYKAVSPPKHVHFFEPSFFRAATSPPPYSSIGSGLAGIDGLGLRPGSGVMLGAHGLTVGFGLWSSRFTSAGGDAEHAEYGVRGSTAGPLLAGSSDALLPGPCVLHATATPEQASALAAQLSEGGDPRVREALDLGIIRAPLYSLAAEVMWVDHGYGGTAPTRRPVLVAGTAWPTRDVHDSTRKVDSRTRSPLPMPLGDFPPSRSTRDGRAAWG